MKGTKRKKIQDNELSDEIYESRGLAINKLAVLALIIFIFGLLINFPLSELIESYAVKNLPKNKACPILIESVDASFFLPKIMANKVEINGRCIKQNRPLTLKKVTISSFFPSFFPIGFKMKVELETDYSKVTAYTIMSFGKTIIKITSNNLSAKELAPFLDGMQYADATFVLEALVNITGQSISDAKINIKSEDLTIIENNIGGLEIPQMTLNNFQLMAIYDAPILDVLTLLIGDAKAPIDANFAGTVKINKSITGNSKVEMGGKVMFSPSFLEEFSIINLMLSGKTPKNGFYEFAIKGTLAKPDLSAL